MEHKDYDDFSKMINNYFQNDYRERGLIKWRGFFLSDHTSALKKFDNDNYFTEVPIDNMPTSKIQEVARDANANYRRVIIQFDSTTFEHKVPKNVTGFVDGYDIRHLYIEGKGYEFESIRGIIKIQDDM
jgi:hypothetical protein